ncbi:hypothetical protein L873DRAFT_1792412 [Choiromyces venosus 120613-1]|uniref:GATA-type domain-containing protein n=1 Tax=Choiromyces venosus 120613-1 TaxID=1336337 RepID=A0A3N4JAH4_9PEZI|nr:hypothetical protein L873DRAFT_1792412 [Choiromyces venosus 120613-1]
MAPTPPGSSVGFQGDNVGQSSSRCMRLKVSYAFDDKNKSNCLARWPHLITTRVVELDKDTVVGAVEFKTCILSMISASPELVATLGQDYSVYAYDYSEVGVPLVGCGMLSWAMATVNSNNPSTNASMITGRVVSNSFGFFSNDGVKETLNVKLKLTPVNTFTQAQFVESVHAYNALSKVIPGGFDASAWTNYLNANPHILTPPGSLTSATSKVSHKVAAALQPPPPSMGDCNPTSGEENGEPPQKKAKTGSARVKKPNNGSRKKKIAATVAPGAPLESIPEMLPLPPTPQVKEDISPPPPPSQPSPTPTPPELCQTMPSNNPMTPMPTTVFSPAYANSPPRTVDSRSMRSSPPTQLEPSRNEISPTPTSPVLPSLCPDVPSPDDLERRLDALFEEEEEELKPSPVSLEQPTTTVETTPEEGSVVDNQPIAPSVLELPKISMPVSLPDDINISAAPSPDSARVIAKPKSQKRKYPRKPKRLTSDAVASSELGEEREPVKRSRSERPQPKPRTAAHVKERIEMQLVQAVTQGKMPNFCMNCGAIETPTWRKVMIARDDNEDDTKDNDVKAEKGEKEILLCNPCGLWHASHKTMRPQDYWDGKKEEPSAPIKKPRVRKRKQPPTSKQTPKEAQQPPTTTTQLPGPLTGPIVVLDEEETPRQAPATVRKVLAMTPRGTRSAKGSNPEWEAASEAAKRAVQSSPIKPGTADSPIDLDSLESKSKSPRRLLFTKPNVNGATNLRPQGSGDGDLIIKSFQGVTTTGDVEKENRAPESLDPSGAASGITTLDKPTTPQKRKVVPLYPRTPIRSGSRTNLGSPSPWNAAIFSSAKKTTATTNNLSPERRPHHSSYHHNPNSSPNHRQTLSPTSAFLERLLEGADLDTASRNLEEMSTDIILGTSPNHHHNHQLPDSTFNFGDDIFGTDMTMPSSPPLFNLDCTATAAGGGTDHDNNALWSEFLPSTPDLGGIGCGLDIFEDIREGEGVGGEREEVEGRGESGGSGRGSGSSSVVPTPTATSGGRVDFSSFIEDVSKAVAAGVGGG